MTCTTAPAPHISGSVDAPRKLAEILHDIPVLSLPQAVLFPHVILPLHVFEIDCVEMVARAMASHRYFVVAMQAPKETAAEAANSHRLPCDVGCLGQIVHATTANAGHYDILLQGIARVSLLERRACLGPSLHNYGARLIPSPSHEALTATRPQWVRLHRCVRSLQEAVAKTDRGLVDVLGATADPLAMLDILSAVFVQPPARQQQLLASGCLADRLEGLIDALLDAMVRYAGRSSRTSRACLH